MFLAQLVQWTIILLLLFGCILMFMTGLLGAVIALIMVLSPLIIVLMAGLGSGLVMGLRTGDALALEHEKQRTQLLAAAPMGWHGASWLIAYIVFMQSSFIRQARSALSVLLRIMLSVWAFLMLFVLVVIALDGGLLAPMRDQAVMSLGAILLAFVLIYVEMVQSVTLGGVVGMMMPGHSRTRFNTRVNVLGVYLAIQLLSYGLALIMLLALHQAGLIPSLLAGMGWLLIGVVTLREILLWILWRLMVNQLHVSAREFWESVEAGR